MNNNEENSNESFAFEAQFLHHSGVASKGCRVLPQSALSAKTLPKGQVGIPTPRPFVFSARFLPYDSKSFLFALRLVLVPEDSCKLGLMSSLLLTL